MTHSSRAARRLTMLAAVAVAIAASSRAAAAQDGAVPNRETALELRKQFMADLDTLGSKFIALAEAIPADKYAWRPAPGVRSVGEAFMHAASEFYTYAPVAYGGARSSVVGRGREGFAYTKQTISALDPSALVGPRKIFGGDHTIIETTAGVTDDLHEHLGQLIAYSRMLGIAPPWSK